jgi:hydrogenase 3 maturation protease
MMMNWPNSWQQSLHQTLWQLTKQQPDGSPLRVVILGIGHELRGDDGVGTAVAKKLLEAGDWRLKIPSLLVLDGAHAPENQTGPIRRFGPQLVLLVDAAFVGQAPGTVELISWQETTGLSATTHTMPPYMLARYLVAELGCEVALLGIQPQQLDMGAGLSAPVQQAVNTVVTGLQEVLGEHIRFFIANRIYWENNPI